MKFPGLSIVFVLFCSVVVNSQDKSSDLNGVWHWNAPKSTISSPATDVRLKIEQNGPDILITWRVLTGENETMDTSYYRIGSDDNRSVRAQGVPVKSSAEWQGSALAIDSVPASVPEAAATHQLWTLAKDGRTLTFKGQRQETAVHGGEDTIIFEKQTDETWGPPRRILPAGQVYQNIQIIQEPAWRLPSGMMSLTRWLGVDCAYCHTLNEFEKDDKPPKKTARQMFKMVHDINENFPGTGPGNFKVTCWTCHRGSTTPETAMPVTTSKASGR
jgi:hypothetical protein